MDEKKPHREKNFSRRSINSNIYLLHPTSHKLTDKRNEEQQKNNIYDFVKQSNRTALVVDCENSDVYKLYSILQNPDTDELNKIEKIYLYDDYHTSIGWDWLYQFTSIPVEHVEVQRVTDRKSLVDIMMTAGVCKSYYEDGIDSFILVSSDSDYWGLICSLPKAKFLVMYEYAKCGSAIKNALSEHDIYYCSIDDFCWVTWKNSREPYCLIFWENTCRILCISMARNWCRSSDA